jgi:hypothetical protein
VHAKTIALVGLQLSLQESWNVPNADLIIYFFAHQSQQMGSFSLLPYPCGYSLASPRKILG